MTKTHIVFALLLAILLAVGAWLFFANVTYAPTEPKPPALPTEPQPDQPATIAERVSLSEPAAESLATNPISISGEAPGNWFFEATAPVVLVDWDGRIIGESYITAEGEWMTTELVPFSGTLSYELPADIYNPRGTLILRRANPSDLPANDAAVEIPLSLTPTTDRPAAPKPTTDLITCTPEQLAAEFCTMEYAPVCGLKEVQCVTTPCDPVPQTYGNACSACAAGVIGYRPGACELE